VFSSNLSKFSNLLSDGVSLLSKKERGSLWFYIVGNTFFITLDTFAITTVTPLVALIVEPELLQKNELLYKFYNYCNFSEYNHFLIFLGIIAMLSIIIGRLGKIGFHYLTRTFGIRCQVRYSKELLNKSIKTPYVWFLSQNPTRLSHFIYTDVLMWSNDFLQRIVNLPSFIITIILSLWAFIFFSPTAGLVSILVMGIIFGFIFIKIKTKLKTLAENRRVYSNEMAVNSNLFFSGIREIKLNQNPDFFSKYFLDSYMKYSASMVSFKFLQLIPNTIIFLVGQCFAVIIALYLNQEGYTRGELTAIMALLLLIISKLIPVASNTFSELSLIINTSPYISGLLDLGKQMDSQKSSLSIEQKDKVTLPESWETIRLDSLSYFYPNTKIPALDDINFSFEKGKMYAIVGSSGGGKTTLINNLLGLLEPASGEILIDDIPLNNLDKKSWYKEFGVVPQKSFFVEGTIASNIALGLEESKIHKENVLRSIKQAQLNELLESLPNGINSIIEDKGGNFSGGQQQRLSLARALYDDPNILLLDEATSSLDVLNEKLIMETLGQLKGKKTIIFITHRLNCLRECDSILFVKDGKLMDSGSFEELNINNPQFSSMVKEFSDDI
tara:strand:+ start:16037 stop:17875 length:1839 start_codon:yes stop_codon:yes gene_type:complete